VPPFPDIKAINYPLPILAITEGGRAARFKKHDLPVKPLWYKQVYIKCLYNALSVGYLFLEGAYISGLYVKRQRTWLCLWGVGVG